MSYNQLRKQGNNKPPFAELSIVTQETKEAISSKKKKPPLFATVLQMLFKKELKYQYNRSEPQ